VSPRSSVRLAWAAAALSWACVAAGVVLWFVDGYDARHLVADGSHLNDALIALTFSAVGALIVSRRPGHRVGVIFCACGVLSGVAELATSYAVHAYRCFPVGSSPRRSAASAGCRPTG
jgi:hypothetical protein